MSRRTPGDGRIIRLLAEEPWPPHDDTGDLEGATAWRRPGFSVVRTSWP
jgi:hypothetical protein